jgi:uncharacterized metal-binding protein
MDCTRCNSKTCRKTESCQSQKFDNELLIAKYHLPENQKIIQAAAQLVDNGRAGTLSRLQEIIEFSKSLDFKTIGLAYCYGMESEAATVALIIRESGLKTFPVSCTTGGFKQSDVNQKSLIDKVSCNPLAQSEQLNNHNVDLTVTMGLCLGHDILFQKNIKSYSTTLLVKDRVYNHNPIEALNN